MRRVGKGFAVGEQLTFMSTVVTPLLEIALSLVVGAALGALLALCMRFSGRAQQTVPDDSRRSCRRRAVGNELAYGTVLVLPFDLHDDGSRLCQHEKRQPANT